MNIEIKHFKNELSDYTYLTSKIKRLEDMKLELDTKRGIRAISYDKEITQGSPDPLLVELKRLDDCDRAEYLDNQLTDYNKRLKHINDFLDTSDLGIPIKRIHCLGTSTYEKESKSMYLSIRQLKRKVNREIIDYLER